MNTLPSIPQPGERFSPYKLFYASCIPEWLERRSDIKPGAKLLYARLARYAGKGLYAQPQQETLAEALGMSVRQVRYYLYTLESKGLIEIEQVGLTRPNRYYFVWQPGFEPAVVAPAWRKEAACPDRQDLADQERQEPAAQERQEPAVPFIGVRESVEENQKENTQEAVCVLEEASEGEETPAGQEDTPDPLDVTVSEPPFSCADVMPVSAATAEGCSAVYDSLFPCPHVQEARKLIEATYPDLTVRYCDNLHRFVHTFDLEDLARVYAHRYEQYQKHRDPDRIRSAWVCSPKFDDLVDLLRKRDIERQAKEARRIAAEKEMFTPPQDDAGDWETLSDAEHNVWKDRAIEAIKKERSYGLIADEDNPRESFIVKNRAVTLYLEATRRRPPHVVST